MAQDYHEPVDRLKEIDKEYVRALNSLREEIEAVDWYTQRVAASNDEQLKKIMYHNAVEEMEHACMTLEWLRRNMDGWDEHLRTYLFTSGDILEIEEGGSSSENKDLGIGEL